MPAFADLNLWTLRTVFPSFRYCVGLAAKSGKSTVGAKNLELMRLVRRRATTLRNFGLPLIGEQILHDAEAADQKEKN